jgi:hypothetical protein
MIAHSAIIGSADSNSYARAHPSLVLVEERFSYSQTISRNPTIDRGSNPAGRIKISVPYDGHEYFGREGIDDVKKIQKRSGTFNRTRDAAIGSLIFVGHEETDLAKVLNISGRFGAYPIRVPTRTSAIHSIEDLSRDAYEHRLDVRYTPSIKRPRALPLVLDVLVLDPDHTSLAWTQQSIDTLLNDEKNGPEKVADEIKKSVGFEPHLILQVKANLALPARIGANPVPPRIRRASVRLPSVSSLSTQSVELRIGGHPQPLHIDPKRNLLEWFDFSMRLAPTLADEEALRRFETPAMRLTFKQPGKLFTEPKVEVRIEAEVPDELLSGAEVRLFDATGHGYRSNAKTPLTTRTVLVSRCTVWLRDAFARRKVSPFQIFYFDEIIPDPLRVSDVHAALTDQRFTILGKSDLKAPKRSAGKNNGPNSAGAGPKRDDLRHVVAAYRNEGPDTLILVVYIEGRRHPTRRQARQPGGRRYTSKFDSGILHLYVRGEMRGNSRVITKEINELQLGLRERFRRLRALR